MTYLSDKSNLRINCSASGFPIYPVWALALVRVTGPHNCKERDHGGVWTHDLRSWSPLLSDQAIRPEREQVVRIELLFHGIQASNEGMHMKRWPWSNDKLKDVITLRVNCSAYI